jgi:protein-tyrosine-phosphatase
MDEIVDVLIVCMNGSARGPIAEALMSVLSKGRIRPFNASIVPMHMVHPYAKELMDSIGYEKKESNGPSNIYDHWQLRGQQADFIYGVCGDVARLTFGNWPGEPRYGRYSSFKQLEPPFQIWDNDAQAPVDIDDWPNRLIFQLVLEGMIRDITEYVVTVMTMVDGREFVPAELPMIADLQGQDI